VATIAATRIRARGIPTLPEVVKPGHHDDGLSLIRARQCPGQSVFFTAAVSPSAATGKNVRFSTAGHRYGTATSAAVRDYQLVLRYPREHIRYSFHRAATERTASSAPGLC